MKSRRVILTLKVETDAPLRVLRRAQSYTDQYIPAGRAEADRLREVVFAALDALDIVAEVASAGVELDDPRIPYVTVQIERETWVALRALAEEERND